MNLPIDVQLDLLYVWQLGVCVTCLWFDIKKEKSN